MDRASSSTVQCTYKDARLPEQRLKPSVFCMHSIQNDESFRISMTSFRMLIVIIGYNTRIY